MNSVARQSEHLSRNEHPDNVIAHMARSYLIADGWSHSEEELESADNRQKAVKEKQEEILGKIREGR